MEILSWVGEKTDVEKKNWSGKDLVGERHGREKDRGGKDRGRKETGKNRGGELVGKTRGKET